MKHIQNKITQITKNHLLYEDHHRPDCQLCGGLRLGTLYREQKLSPRNANQTLNGQFGHLCLIHTWLGIVLFKTNSPIVKLPSKTIPGRDDRHTKGEFLSSVQLFFMSGSPKILLQIVQECCRDIESREPTFRGASDFPARSVLLILFVFRNLTKLNQFAPRDDHINVKQGRGVRYVVFITRIFPPNIYLAFRTC